MAAPLPSDPKELQAYLAQLFSNPALLPANFLSYLNDYYAVNQLPVPASNIIGISDYIERLDQNTDTVTVANTTTETEIYGYEVPAGLLQTKGAIRTEIGAKYLQNSGLSPTLRIRVKYGATTMHDSTSNTVSSNSAPYAMGIVIVLGNAGATNSQNMIGYSLISRGSPVAGYGQAITAGIAGGTMGGTASEDSTAKKRLSITVEHSTAHANTRVDKYFAYTTRIAH